MNGRILALDAGTAYHHFALTDMMSSALIDGTVYVPEFDAACLEAADALIVTCRTPASLLEPHAGAFQGFLARGHTLVAMGETQPQRWLPDIRFTPGPTNFWWWLDPDGDLGLRIGAADHPLYEHLRFEDTIWHHHGHLDPPDGAVSMIDKAEGGSVLYEDRVTTPGRLIVTTLDPFYHHGSFFMPASSRFLRGFLAWLRASVGQEVDRSDDSQGDAA